MSDDTMSRVFGSLCDALSCPHDNEAALEAIARLRAEVAALTPVADAYDAQSAAMHAMEENNARLRAALADIRDCLGGDTPMAGPHSPSFVWGIATAALEK